MHLADFEKALRLGLGRPAVFLQTHDAAPYRDAILHACLHDLNYDGDFEANRAAYMYQVLQHTGEPEFYQPHILQALAASDDDDAAYQLFELALRFAQAGDAEARQVMYTRFEANSIMGIPIGGRSIIELDKAAGLVAVAAAIGGRPRPEDDDWYDDQLLRVAEDEGVEDPWQTLQAAATAQPRIHDFLAKVADYRARKAVTTKGQSRRDPAAVHYAEIKGQIIGAASQQQHVNLLLWAKSASDDDLVTAANDMLVHSDVKAMRAYLRIFGERTFPLEPEHLIKLVSHPDRFIHLRAMGALAHVRHPAVRALALHLLDTPNLLAAWAVGLLRENYADGDTTRVETLAPQLLEAEAIHHLGHEVPDFFAAHLDPASEERLLLHLYENGPCSLCRARFVLRLAALNRLPAWMAEEVRYDADPGLYTELEKYRSEYANEWEPT